MIEKNHSLFIKARIEERMYADKEGKKPLEIKVKSVKLLSNIREDMVKKITISIKLSDLNNANIKMLEDALQKKGNVNLYFMVIDEETGLTLNLLSHSKSIEITNELADFLRKNENMVTYSLNNGQMKKRRSLDTGVPDTDADETDNPMPVDPVNDDD